MYITFHRMVVPQTDCLTVTSVFILDYVNVVMISKWRSEHPIGMVPMLNQVAFNLGCSQPYCFSIGLLSNGCMHLPVRLYACALSVGCALVRWWTVYCSCISSGERITNSGSVMYGENLIRNNNTNNKVKKNRHTFNVEAVLIFSSQYYSLYLNV